MRSIPRGARALVAAIALTVAAADTADAAGAAGVPPTADLAPAIIGTVTDSAGAPLPNVQVIVAAANRRTTTDERGTFAIRGLAPGRYHIDAVLIGYARADTEVIVPADGPDVSVRIVMRATPIRLANVVVSATPTGADPLALTQSTVELSGRELARALGASVAQTLSSEPGIAMRYNGPAANIPVIRGLTGERILVLQDGQRSGDLASTQSDHGLTIDPLAASRIEVVRGPASLLYGTNALGGVVNVISDDIPTTVPTRVEGFVAGQGESVNPGGAASGAVTAPIGAALALSVRGGFRSLDDTRMGGGDRLLNSFTRNNHQTVGLGYVGGEATHAGVAYRRFDFEYGLPSTSDDPEAGARIDGVRNELTARGDFGGWERGVFSHLRVDATAQWYGHDEIEAEGEVATSFELTTQTANATARTRFGHSSGAIGVSGIFRQYAPTGEEALTPESNSSSGGIFIFHEIPLRHASEEEEHEDAHGGYHGVPTLQLGARYDRSSISTKAGDEKFGPARSLDFGNVSGSIGVTVPLASGASIGVSAARAFRAPTVEELFSNAFHAAVGTFDVGNPDLDAEVNQGIDAVLRVQRPRIDAQLAGYYNRIENFIFPSVVGDTITDEGEEVPLNRFAQRDATLRGVEGRVEGEVLPKIVVGAMGDIVRGDLAEGGPLPFLPAARLGGLARWDDGRWSLGIEARHAFAQDRVSGGDVDIATDAYTLVNLSAGLNLIHRSFVHSITLRADNLFDERYRDASSRIKSFAFNPGRNLTVVYRVLF